MSNNHFFEGFELPHSGEEGDGLIIPRSFFDRVVITEPASTIRVVAFILLRTLAGQDEVEASYTDFVRELRLCRQSVQEGLARAIEAGYIRLVQSGENGHIKSRYAICWATSSSSPPPSSPPPDKGGSSTNHHGSSSSTTSTPTSTPPTISTLPVRKNQNATRQPSPHSPTNQTTEEKQTGNISRTLPSPAALAGDSNSNNSSKVTSVINKVSMINRRVESSIESGVPARKADQHPQQQQDFYYSTFPSTTTTPAATASIASSTIPIPTRSYYCHDSLAAASFPVCDTLATPLPTPATKPTLTISSYLSHLSSDLSREFADISHVHSNRTQIHNLWHQTHLSEAEFAHLMYQARELTRRHAVLRPGEVPPPPGQRRNRMPYFFACLRDLLGLRGDTEKVAVAAEKGEKRLSKGSHSSRLNDQSFSAKELASSAAPSHQKDWRRQEGEKLEQPPQGNERLEDGAYTSTGKLSYMSGSPWREAQSFTGEMDTEDFMAATPTSQGRGYALADSSVLPAPSSSSQAAPGELLTFPKQRLLGRRSRGTTMAASLSSSSDYSNSSSSYQKYPELEEDWEVAEEVEEGEARAFTADHTQSVIASTVSYKDRVSPASKERVGASVYQFGGAEARSRERYLAKYGPRGFPGSERLAQAITKANSST